LAVGSRLDGPALVRADADRLHQALGNLLANAARYCRPGDEVSVVVRSEADKAVLEVVDSGPGIPADELPHVFDRLWRGRAAKQVAGSGIGLAVAREIVVAHSGTIAAISSEGTGTTITIRLPLSK
jgi:two-component system sensor histidine kinase BaeS